MRGSRYMKMLAAVLAAAGLLAFGGRAVSADSSRLELYVPDTSESPERPETPDSSGGTENQTEEGRTLQSPSTADETGNSWEVILVSGAAAAGLMILKKQGGRPKTALPGKTKRYK